MGGFKQFPPAPAAITVKEADGTPTVLNVSELSVSNDTLTDDTGGKVSLAVPTAAHVHTHASATGQTANDHHAEAHVHTHASTTGQAVNDHHDEAHAAKHTDGTDDIQDATPAQSGVMTATQATKLSGIETAADVTDSTNVAAAGAVLNTGAEAVAGVKTFSSFPVTPSLAPTTDYQVANKKYVDDTGGGGGGGGGATTALDNLAAVAINEALIYDTDGTYDIGSATYHAKDIYYAGDLIRKDGGGTDRTGYIYVPVPDASISFDFDKTDFTTDGTWKINGLDLTSYVAAGAKAVRIYGLAQYSASYFYFSLRKSSGKMEVHYNTFGSGAAYLNHIIELDDDRLLDYKGSGIAFVTIGLKIMGFFI